jgi:hypothetical protein
MKTLKITINLDRDAFRGDFQTEEVARILREYADTMAAEYFQVPRAATSLYDNDGNTVGAAKVTG